MIEIFHADAHELTPAEFSACDVQIIDPPYSAHVHENAVTSGTVASGGPHEREFGFDPLTPGLREHILLAAAHVKRWSLVFTDELGMQAWIDGANAGATEYVRWLPWIRWSQPQLSGDRPPSGAEIVLHFHAPRPKGVRMHWNGPGSLTHYARRCMRGSDKHPTEKPIDLMLDMVAYFSDPGETVLDMCAGSGTTALACRLLGRGCMAIEKDAAWAGHARERVAAPLSKRDSDRVCEWLADVDSEAGRVPTPKAVDGSDVRTWERAQRRLADVARVRAAIKRAA